MEITQLTAASVVNGIKNNMTIDDFCRKYQCTPERFRQRMKQIYSHDQKNLKHRLSEIEANEKKPRKKSTEAKLDPVGTELDDSQTGTKQDENTDLKKLRVFENEQSGYLMALESKYQELASKHRASKTSLQNLSEKIDKLMLELKKLQETFEEILESNSSIEASMNKISEEWRSVRSRLVDTRKKIQELTTVTLCVYASGEIAPMDGRKIELDDSGWKGIRDELLMSDECQELRIKDVATLGRLLAIVKNVEKEGFKIEVICDSSELEKVFQKLR